MPRFAGAAFYRPKDSGYEKTIKERLEWLANRKRFGSRDGDGPSDS